MFPNGESQYLIQSVIIVYMVCTTQFCKIHAWALCISIHALLFASEIPEANQ